MGTVYSRAIGVFRDMTHHVWGDDFDWQRLDAAGEFISSYCIHRARLRIHWKEKWGTLRYEYLECILFGEWPIHALIKPGYLFYQFPKWFRPIEDVLGYVLEFLRISPMIRKYQLKIFKEALMAAVERYPDLKDEILSDAPEEVVGKEIHNQYWTRMSGDE